MKRTSLAPVVIALLVGGAAAGGWYVWHHVTLKTFAETPVQLAQSRTVPLSGSPKKIAHALAEAGVVTDEDLAYRYIRAHDLGPRLKAGEYEFSGSITPEQALERIVNGEVKTYRVTIPEGLRVDEILPLLTESGLELDAGKLAALAENADFLKELGVPAPRAEGFLFPDTYTFTRSATEEAVLKKLISRALDEYAKANAQRSPEVKLDLLQTFTLASIIEKETGAKEERPHISCVFHNRLRQHIKLQTDPTVLYAASLIRGAWVNNITRRDLTTPHPYNTYTTFGLPPGPIANPGAAALKAALHPDVCEDLFFVSRNDGTHVFCPNLECHNAAVEQWQKHFFKPAATTTTSTAPKTTVKKKTATKRTKVTKKRRRRH